MQKYFKTFFNLIEDAKIKLENLPNIRTCEVKNDNDTVIIVGDLHGNFRDLKYIIDKYGIPGSNYQFIFNGDFVDRGNQQIEVLLTILYSFILYPDRVFLNRGNHEDISMNKIYNSKGFFDDIKMIFINGSSKLFEACENLFQVLPLATIVENTLRTRLFVVHGGISWRTQNISYLLNDIVRKNYTSNKLSTIKDRYERYKNESEYSEKNQRLKLQNDREFNNLAVISDLLWSDPGNLNGTKFNKNRNIGCVFGSDITQKFLKSNNLKYLIRSHEYRPYGFSKDQSRCFTIFSASNYQTLPNFGSVIQFSYKDTEISHFVTYQNQ